MRYAVNVVDLKTDETIVASTDMNSQGVVATLKHMGDVSDTNILLAIRNLEKHGHTRVVGRGSPERHFSFEIKPIVEKTPVVSNCQYRVHIVGHFDGGVVLDWVIVPETGLRLLLRRVCGASVTQCDAFIEGFDKAVRVRSFDGVNGQENLAYTLVAFTKGSE